MKNGRNKMKQLNELVTDKDVFDYVSSFLINQNEKSTADDIGCAYRGDEGKKCAIGCIIADEFYHPSIEKQTAYDTKVLYAVKDSLPKYTINDRFLSKLQEVHDGFESELWELKFSRFQFTPEGVFESVLDDDILESES